MKELAHGSMTSKQQPTWRPLYRDLFLFVAIPCLPQRALPPTYTLMQGFPPCLALKLNLPCQSTQTTPAYLALCRELENVGQERT